jgi:hypothetical protein
MPAGRITIDHSGKRFGRLLVLKEGPRSNSNRVTWVCVCTCGKIKTISALNLTAGDSLSCGCLRKETTSKQFSTHKATNSFEYRVWCGMLSRCRNPKLKGYHRYGGRGIKVCDRWANSFEAFLSDVGSAPSDEHSIDRFPDNDGNYEPLNCRWSTDTEQARNKSNNRRLVFRGAERTIAEICEMTGLRHATIRYRAARNLTLDSERYTNPRVRNG